MPAEPHIRSPFSERLTPESLILKVIGLGRVGPHCMAAYRSHCSRRSTRPDPAALGANALTEPTAESTVGLVSHPHPGKLDHCGAQTRIACLRDTLFLVDAATLPWTGSQAGIGRQLPSVLKVAEQTLKVEHGSELRANALEPHK